MRELIPYEVITSKIFLIREQKVMLDNDLATLYGVTTFNMNKAVKRNRERFPEDFMFQLSPEEFKSLTFQIGISKKGRGGRRYLPYAFTEQGVAMLSSILRSKRAISVNIQIMRAFVKVKQFILTHKELAQRLGALEILYGEHDKKIKSIFEIMKQLSEPQAEEQKEKIGFIVRKKS